MHDLVYYRQRARQERESAERCKDMSARRIHQELAERYHRLAQATPPSA